MHNKAWKSEKFDKKIVPFCVLLPRKFLFSLSNNFKLHRLQS